MAFFPVPNLNPSPMQSQSGAPFPMALPQIPAQQMAQPSFAQNFRQNLGPVLQAIGIDIASGGKGRGLAMMPSLIDNRQQRMAQMQAQQQQAEQQNKTKQWLQAQGRTDLVPLVDAGQADVALRMAMDKGQAAEQEQFGVSPVYGTDPKTGKTVLGVIGNRGSFKPLDTGGMEISSGVDKVDLGTQFALIDKRTGQTIGIMPKENYQAEFDKGKGSAEGTAAGQATVAAPKDLQAAENALTMIDSIRNDPAKGIGTGASSFLNAIPGSPGYGFQTKVDQLKAGAFMTAIQALRGMGALSNAEGATATAAVTRMSTALSQEDFDAALNEYERIVRQGYAKAAQITGGGQPINPDMPAEDPLGLR